MNSFYSEEELAGLGLKSYGKNVWISRKASIYGAENLAVGSNVRIDDFCILSGKITIGNYVHVAAYCGLFAGEAGISMDDFSGLSSRVSVYAVTDDFSGNALTNPTIPEKYRHAISKPVTIGKHVVVGTGCAILPGAALAEGGSFAAMSMINKETRPWTIYAGNPCKRLIDRNKKALMLERDFLKSIENK